MEINKKAKKRSHNMGVLDFFHYLCSRKTQRYACTQYKFSKTERPNI